MAEGKNEINAILCGTGLSHDSSTDRKLREAFHAQTSRTVEVTICIIPERTARLLPTVTVRFTTTWVSRSKSARLCNHCKLEHRYCEALRHTGRSHSARCRTSQNRTSGCSFFAQHDDNTRHVCAMVLSEHPKPAELPPTSMMECSFEHRLRPSPLESRSLASPWRPGPAQ